MRATLELLQKNENKKTKKEEQTAPAEKTPEENQVYT